MTDVNGHGTRSPVIDFDGHVIEPNEMWEELIDSDLKARAPRGTTDSRGITRLMVESTLYPTPEGPGRAPVRLLTGDELGGYRDRLIGGRDPQTRLEHMDIDGIDIALLLPSQGLVVGAIRDPALATGVARAYNTWLARYCSAAPERLLGTAVLALQDIDRALAELRRAIGELGFRAVYMRPNPVAGRTLADPHYVPLYALIEEMEIPLLLHEGCGFAPGATMGVDRFENGLFSHAMSHTLEQMTALLSVICGGVLERFPRLQVAFLESGCSWVPYWLERLDDHFEVLRHEVPWLTMRPSEYFARQCTVAFEGSERMLPHVIEDLGAERLVYASDYPHSDAPFPSVAPIREREDLTAEQKDLLLGGNAARLLKLRPEDVPVANVAGAAATERD
jgi:predicted TIM-barrel fold metal-dependent hydrolase